MYNILSPEIYTLLSVGAISILPLVAGLVLLVNKKIDQFVFVLVSLSVGAMFGNAFIHLIPQAFNEGNSLRAAFWILFGILFLFVLEKFFNWRHEHIHHHDAQCAHAILPLGHLSLIAGGAHNFIDGAVIAASYLINIPVGVATTIAIIFHKIPNDIGNLGILVHAGFSKRTALFYNFYSGLIVIVGAVMTLLVGNIVQNAITIIIPFAAGNFIYIAGSDLVPELHKTKHLGHSLLQLVSILAGIGLMALLLLVE